MKLNFKRSDLLNSVNIVLKAVSSRTTMPILECILIDASEKGVYLTANDMELGIETGVENCQVLEGGRAAVDAKLFSEIIRKISLEDDSVITVTGDESSIITIMRACRHVRDSKVREGLGLRWVMSEAAGGTS